MKKLLLSSVFAFAASALSAGAGAQVIVIANPSVKASEVSKDELRDVFTGNASALKDGSKVVPILLKDGPPHEQFLKAYIGKGDTAYATLEPIGQRFLTTRYQRSAPYGQPGQPLFPLAFCRECGQDYLVVNRDHNGEIFSPRTSPPSSAVICTPVEPVPINPIRLSGREIE